MTEAKIEKERLMRERLTNQRIQARINRRRGRSWPLGGNKRDRERARMERKEHKRCNKPLTVDEFRYLEICLIHILLGGPTL